MTRHPQNSPETPSESSVKVAAAVVAVTTIAILMGNLLCCWRSGEDTSEEEDPASQLYREGAAAWARYLDDGQKGPDLAETIKKCNEALDAAQKEHPQRNDILLMLVFALLERNLDQPSLEKIEACFSELEGWNDLEKARKADAHAIAAKLAAKYHGLYNQAPSDSDLERCLSSYTRVRKYSDKPEDGMAANLVIVSLYRQGGQPEKAMRAIESAKSACPPDRPDLLSSICMTKFTLHQDMYGGTGSSEELEKAIAEGEAVLQFDIPPAQRATILAGVAQCICASSEAQPSEASVEGRIRDAIKYAREAVELNGEESSRIQASIALANALASRRIEPTIQELDEAVSLYQKAQAFESDPELLASLAGAICFRCEKGGEVADGITVQSAVKLYEEALLASSDDRWNSRIANNIAYIYVEKANNTNDEADYENARKNYLKAANYLEAVETGSDPGDANDIGYYRDRAKAVTETIARLKKQPTARGSL
ncbi:hypothetical protein EST38_g11320 [Candolleomyces aberdarensis]|uniref:Tetratricopeptide repeat protein n=1 Tax=Candolleomyces aberdarensis TaxID=2316362 RepID=A0A4Q2D6N3_9AGAR|nr:hypothetical protein EST38_g11320 [Candolleomyces aberdarensis]